MAGKSFQWVVAGLCATTLIGCAHPPQAPRTFDTVQRLPQPQRTRFEPPRAPSSPQDSALLVAMPEIDLKAPIPDSSFGSDDDAPSGAMPEGADYAMTQPHNVPNQLIVALKPGAELRQFRAFSSDRGLRVMQDIQIGTRYQVVQLPAGMSLEEGRKLYANNPAVSAVSENRIYAVATAPNDPYYDDQWGSKKIKADAAWARRIDASGVTVAVLDTGVDYQHPEFGGRVIRGWNFIDNNQDVMDRFGHGTHVAGIIGAAGGNGVGVAGVAWNAKILAVKVLGDNGQGSTSAVLNGIKYATDMGAKVINLSLGSPDTDVDPALGAAISYATQKGCLVVAAAGNNRGGVGSPANDPGAIAVSSTSKFLWFEYLSWFSNRGSQIEVAAPGGGIWSTVPLNPNRTGKTGYGKLSGTSMACPYVAGEAALIFAKYPGWTAQQVRTRIQSAVDDKGSNGRDFKYGFGRINLEKALY